MLCIQITFLSSGHGHPLYWAIHSLGPVLQRGLLAGGLAEEKSSEQQWQAS